jgi:hypothetical protein
MDPDIHRGAMRRRAPRDPEADIKNVLAVLLVALAACGADTTEKPIQYGAPQAPTVAELGAGESAAATLQASLSYQASTQPDAGVAGLGDQLVQRLGGSTLAARMPTAGSAKLVQGAVRQAFDTGGLDPACVTHAQVGDVTTVTWGAAGPCHVVMTEIDPTTGATTMTVTVDIVGTLAWNAATRETTWNVDETMSMTMAASEGPVTVNATARLQGSTKATDTTFVASTGSTVDMRTTVRGMAIDEALATTLAANLGYQADPFCVTSGTLTVEQRWTKRPMGATAADLPDRGWRLEWSGCGAFTVAHGS